MRKSTFFYNIFLRYIFIVLVATLTITCLVFYNGTALRNSQVFENQKNIMGQARDKMDSKLSVAFQLVNQFENDSDVNQYMKNSVTDYYNVFKVVGKLSDSINIFSGLGIKIALNKDSDDLVLAPDAIYKLSDYARNIGVDQFTVQNIKNDSGGADHGNKLYYARNKTFDAYEKTMVTIILHKQYNSAALNYYISFYEDEFFPLVDAHKQESFIVADENRVIAADASTAIDPILSDLKSKDAFVFKTNPPEFNTTTMGYRAYITKSNVLSDWNYIYITPKNSYYDRNIILSTVVIFIIILSLGIWVALQNAKIIYSPINKVINVFKTVGDIESGNLNEIEFIQRTAVSISSTNEELLRIVSDKSEHLKVKALTDLLYGMLKQEDIEDIIDNYQLQKLLKPVRVIIVEFLDTVSLEHSNTKEEAIEIRNNILLFLKERFTEASGSLVFDIDYKRYCIIIGKDDNRALKKELNSIINIINATFNVEVGASIGKSVSSLFEVDQSFSDALFLSEQRQVSASGWVITGDDLNGINSYGFYYPLDIERNLIYYIVKGEKEKANAILNSVLRENLHENTLRKEDLVEFKFAIAATLKRVLRQINKTTEEVFGEGSITYLELNMCKNASELEDKIIEMFNREICSIHTNPDGIDPTLINRMTAYIKENYNKDLSLTNLSEHFNLSVSHISKLFKSQIQINFKDYLNTYRVQKAKELMIQNKGIQINDVAQRIGYNSPITFIRIFKKYEGISPGEFLKNENKAAYIK